MKYKTTHDMILDGRNIQIGAWEKPKECPHCGTTIEAIVHKYGYVPYYDNRNAYMISMRCPACEEIFIGIYVSKPDKTGLEIWQIMPMQKDDATFKKLEALSEGFAKYHRQAFRAEINGDTEIAALGYRTAVEHLLKDFAIKEMGRGIEAAKGSLSEVIKLYPDDIQKTANVARIVGNDCAHYEQKHQDIDFRTFKYYYKLMLTMVQVQHDIINAPE